MLDDAVVEIDDVEAAIGGGDGIDGAEAFVGGGRGIPCRRKDGRR